MDTMTCQPPEPQLSPHPPCPAVPLLLTDLSSSANARKKNMEEEHTEARTAKYVLLS